MVSMIRVRCSNPPGLKHKVEQCIKLLDEEYQSLDYSVDIYKERSRLEYEQKKNPDMDAENYNQILTGGKFTPVGITLSNSKKIKLFLFNLEGEEYPDYKLMFYLYHELRHAWQNVNGLYIEEPIYGNLEENDSDYKASQAEADANSFAQYEINKNKESIKKIVQIPSSVIISDITLNW